MGQPKGLAIMGGADAQKRVPPRGERTPGGSRFRATWWLGNVWEATA